MFLVEENYKLNIDGSWDINDLYTFSRNYEQVYYAIYSLYPHDDEKIEKKIKGAYSSFPWQGGYSAVNFYDQLKYTTPSQKRLKILTMQYASPGWFELSIIIGVAVSIKQIVGAITFSIKEMNSTYNEIYRGAKERKLLKIQVEQTENEHQKKMAFEANFKKAEGENLKFIEEQNEKLARILKIEDVKKIHEKTGSPLKTLKILMSLYRRVRKLSELGAEGKLKL